MLIKLRRIAFSLAAALGVIATVGGPVAAATTNHSEQLLAN